MLGVSVAEPANSAGSGVRKMERLVRFLHTAGRCDPPNTHNERNIGCILRRNVAAITKDLRSVDDSRSALKTTGQRPAILPLLDICENVDVLLSVLYPFNITGCA